MLTVPHASWWVGLQLQHFAPSHHMLWRPCAKEGQSGMATSILAQGLGQCVIEYIPRFAKKKHEHLDYVKNQLHVIVTEFQFPVSMVWNAFFPLQLANFQEFGIVLVMFRLRWFSSHNVLWENKWQVVRCGPCLLFFLNIGTAFLSESIIFKWRTIHRNDPEDTTGIYTTLLQHEQMHSLSCLSTGHSCWSRKTWLSERKHVHVGPEWYDLAYPKSTYPSNYWLISKHIYAVWSVYIYIHPCQILSQAWGTGIWSFIANWNMLKFHCSCSGSPFFTWRWIDYAV